MAYDGNTWLTYLIFSLIALAAFLGNALVLYVLVTRPSYLKRPYNIFIFSLALADIIASIFLVFSRFLFLPPLPGGELSREIYCRTIWPGLIVFNLVFISLHNVLALTIERWLAVVKPLLYRSIKPHHAVKAVVFVWIWGTLANVSTIWRTKFDKVNQECSWTTLDVANDELPWLEFSLQTVIPSSIIIILYGHILHAIKQLPSADNGHLKSIKRVTMVAFATSTAMIISTIPSRITFMMSKVSSLDANGLLHFCLVTLAMSNCAVNPILYGIYSSQFRREYRVILQNLLLRCRTVPQLSSQELSCAYL